MNFNVLLPDTDEAVVSQVDNEDGNPVAGPSRIHNTSDFSSNLSATEIASRSSDTSSLPKSPESECADGADARPQQSESYIKIRLKYLNDDSRQVDGLLNEKLADFKKYEASIRINFPPGFIESLIRLCFDRRRTFPEELAARKIIRLIFNGRVLRDDNVVLQNYGLFNDCVVHCLIMNEKQRQPSNSEPADQSQHFTPSNESTSTPEWNLSKLFCFMVVGILSLTWYCRFQFAALFTFTSTSFLLGLTIIFLCSLYGTFYVDSVPLNSIG